MENTKQQTQVWVMLHYHDFFGGKNQLEVTVVIQV